MKIALDFDGTYTRDPKFWADFIYAMKDSGHEVFICTMRTPQQTEQMLEILKQIIPVYFTSLKSKRKYMAEELGIFPDIWIDDQPEFILFDAQGA